MTPNLILGFSLILVSAVASGVFGVALRKRRVFSVELMWLIIFLTGYRIEADAYHRGKESST